MPSRKHGRAHKTADKPIRKKAKKHHKPKGKKLSFTKFSSLIKKLSVGLGLVGLSALALKRMYNSYNRGAGLAEIVERLKPKEAPMPVFGRPDEEKKEE
jgi:hypothetical protein